MSAGETVEVRESVSLLRLLMMVAAQDISPCRKLLSFCYVPQTKAHHVVFRVCTLVSTVSLAIVAGTAIALKKATCGKCLPSQQLGQEVGLCH